MSEDHDKDKQEAARKLNRRLARYDDMTDDVDTTAKLIQEFLAFAKTKLEAGTDPRCIRKALEQAALGYRLYIEF